MKIWHRRLLTITFLLAAFILVAIVAAYIGRNLVGMGPVPTRSAFSGRLPSTPDGDMRRFQFFYATNREDSKDTFNGYGNKLGNGILNGTFDVRISPYMLIKPHSWFDKENMEWANREALPEDKFLSKLRDVVQASPQKSILIIVWGFRDWFQSAALKTAYTAYVLDINTPVLLFDWPGNQGEGLRGYAASRRMTPQSALDLAHLLAKVIPATGAQKVWLMGSSLGCQTIADSFKLLDSRKDMVNQKVKVDEVILSAPDVSARAFDDKFSKSFQALANHLTVYVSSNDRALLMSRWVNRGRRLGRLSQAMLPPETRSSEYEFEEALELLDLEAKGMKNISVVDATPINRTRNLHHFFTDSPEFFDDIYRRFLQPDNNISRPLHSVRTNRGVIYWILWGS
jgi:esterase/lipase superfamily enzyme